MARKPYRMTPARRAALKKAQLVSARKRQGTGKTKTKGHFRRNAGKYAATAVVVGAVAAASATSAHKKNQHKKKVKRIEANIQRHMDKLQKNNSASVKPSAPPQKKTSSPRKPTVSAAEKERKRRRRNERYARQSGKLADRGLYTSGFGSVGSGTIIAGTRGAIGRRGGRR